MFISDKNAELYLKEYDNGLSISEISSVNNCKWATVYQVVKNNREYIQEEKDICDLYNSGQSTGKIAKYYGINHHLVSKILEKHNIQRTGECRRKYQLNESYFDSIDSAIKAYILGFLFADGSNNIKKGTVSMSLQEGDQNILERIRNEVGSNRELEYIDYTWRREKEQMNYKNQYRLSLFSIHMCHSLNDKGMAPNKSLVLEFPNWLNPDYISHFLRGYFDGDGSVHFAKNGNVISSITSTELFCTSAQKYIETATGIHTHINDASCHNGITKVLTISGRKQVKTFLDYIYKDATIYLERKYKLYTDHYYNSSYSVLRAG